MPLHSVVDQFVSSYVREYDFYYAAAHTVQQHLEAILRAEAIRAIVTSRAKRPDRLEAKLRKLIAKGQVETPEALREQIPDLAGARIALYFPGQRERVNALIAERFVAVGTPRVFPGAEAKPKTFSTAEGAEYGKRFAGYHATHHRVRLRDERLPDDERRLAIAHVEIQVASVFMHAWAEVEHDLVYKPLAGTLSLDEHAVLDELNGLALSSELALERLERAGDARLSGLSRAFADQYELASFLASRVRKRFGKTVSAAGMGHADWLFDVLRLSQSNTPDKVLPLVERLDSNIEERPIADQIMEGFVEGRPERYALLEQLRTQASPYGPIPEQERQGALGFFIDRWVALEQCITLILRTYRPAGSGSVFSPGELRDLSARGIVAELDVSEVDRLRRLRNILIHGEAGVNPEIVRTGALAVEQVLHRLAASSDAVVSKSAKGALQQLGSRNASLF